MTAHLRPVPNAPELPASPVERPDAAARPSPTPTRPSGAMKREEFERMADLVATGADLDAVVADTGRSRGTVVKYLRQMLPLEERACPDQLLDERLHEHFTSGNYDWRAAMRLTPPPPVIEKVERMGVPGLSDHHLVTIALVLADRTGPGERALHGLLVPELRTRHLGYVLREARTRELCRAGLAREQAERAASIWVTDHYDLMGDYGHTRDPWRSPHWPPQDEDEPFYE